MREPIRWVQTNLRETDAALTLAVNGTLDHEDRQAIEAAHPIFRWAAEHQQYYTGQESAARVLLLGGPAGTGRSYSQASYRGMFRFLSEEHIRFAVADNMKWLGKPSCAEETVPAYLTFGTLCDD
jgi:hypothetical protein